MRSNDFFEPRDVHAGSFVRLVRPITELSLREGDVGVVREILPGPADTYEVEFHRIGQHVPARALLQGTQIAPQDGPLMTDERVGAPRWWQ